MLTTARFSNKTRWKKLGHVYAPSGQLPWAKTHAANPVAEHISGDQFRIYFSARDEQNKSAIGSVVIDMNNPTKVIEEAQEPVLAPGELGMFDDCGASIGCIVPINGKRYLYYMGWNLAVTVPWKNALGVAISDGPGQPFKRHSRFPIVPLDEVDPYTISYPWIIQEGNLYRMWYGSNLKWGPVKEDMLHIIKYAESFDGINWTKTNQIVIDSSSPAEYAICKPCVIKDADNYWMWFCSRGDKYRIKFAQSPDGINWTRIEDAGIDVSDSGWDSEMIEYPSVFKHKENYYLLYCGAAFGKTGFGIAVLDR